ncbi:MAG: AAA family ATPase, partial [Candidatus Brocadiales bacterium]|nr:AAA family ATPase [Candidatus Bathyanammoxibius sp.]
MQTLGELLQSVSITVPSYIGNGILPIQGKLVLGAERGFGKSILVSNMIYDLASGWPVFNQPLLSVSQVCRVLYIENEVGEDGLRVRFGLIHDAKQSPLALENIVIKSREQLLFLDRSHINTPAQVENQDQWLKVLEAVRPDIIVGDPLATLHSA